jgi:hypothetical protein
MPGVYRYSRRPYRRTLPRVRRMGWYYAPAALTVGTPVQVCTATAVTIYHDGTNGSTETSGGVPPLTYQWHTSTTSDFTPGGGTAIGGATSQNLTVGSPDTTLRFYKCVVTDGAAQTVTTVEAPGRLLDGALKVLFIGDSLYYNPSTPATYFDPYADYLQGLYSVTVEDRSAPGSGVNYWLPDGDPNQLAWPDGGPPDTDGVPLLEWVFANVSDPTHVIIRLGTNDSPIAVATWTSRMQTIVDAIATQYPAAAVCVKYVPYGRPAGSYGGSANARFQEFNAAIETLTGVNAVFGRKTWDASAVLTGYRTDDIHFAAYGARLDAAADLHDLEEYLNPDAGGGGGGGRQGLHAIESGAV